jgi:acetolactate synthase I/III small subunit
VAESTLTLQFAEGTGALDRIIGLLRRRGFPISGMTLERTHADGIGRMTVVVDGQDHLEQVARHLRRLPDVMEVTNAGVGTIQREYALVRVHCTPEQRTELEAVIQRHGGRIISTGDEYLAVEVSGRRDDLDAMFSELVPYGIEESARTNPMALHAGAPAPQVANGLS